VWPQSVAPAHDRTGADSLLVAAATVAVVAILFHMLIVLLFALVLFAAVCLVHNYPLSSFLILRTTVYRIAPSFVKSPACRPDLSAPLTPLYAPLRGYHTAGKVSIPASNLGPDVKSTKHESGRLLVTPDAEDDWKFVLVTGAMPTYKVIGWMWGRDAKREEWLTILDPRRPACYAMPQDKLKSFVKV